VVPPPRACGSKKKDAIRATGAYNIVVAGGLDWGYDLSGVVKDSSVSAYLGRHMLLTVEDGGEGKNADPDRYTWGQYRSTAATWTASDGELVFDPGVGLTWTATDAERTDDVGVPSSQPAGVDCKSFPLGSYALEDLPLGSGNVQVRQ